MCLLCFFESTEHVSALWSCMPRLLMVCGGIVKEREREGEGGGRERALVGGEGEGVYSS